MGKRTSKLNQSSADDAAAAAAENYDEDALNQAPTSSVEVTPVVDRDNFPELSGDADDNTVMASDFDPNATVIMDARAVDTGAADAVGTTSDEVTPEDIEQTRADMSRTIDAIKEKLNPETLKEQAKDALHDATVGKVETAVHNVVESAKETASNVWESAREKFSGAGHSAKGAGYNMIDTIKENPIPAALAGIGIGWLIASSRSSDSDRYERSYDSTYPRSYESGRYSATYYDSRNESRFREEDEGPSLRERASDVAHEAKERVGDMADSARERVSDFADAAKYRVARPAIDIVRENPLPAALAGIGIGWLIASARSSDTDRYDYRSDYRSGNGGEYDRAGRYYGTGTSTGVTGGTSYSGDAADQPGLRERASEAAHEAKERVSEAAHDAKERVSEFAHDAKERVGEFAHDARERVSGVASSAWEKTDRYVIDTVKENPIPAALIGIGIGWLIAGARRGDETDRYRGYASDRFGTGEYRSADYPYEANRFGASTEEDRSIRDRVSGAAHEAKERVGDMTESARERVGELYETVGEKASHVRDRVSNTASDVTYRVRETASRASDGFERTLNDNPFAVGAMALVLGVAVGLALPETEHENRWMGETRDRLVDQVSEKAKNVASRVQDVAGDALATVKTEAKDAFDTVKTEVTDVTRDAFAVAKAEVKDELTDGSSQSSANL